MNDRRCAWSQLLNQLDLVVMETQIYLCLKWNAEYFWAQLDMDMVFS